MFGSQPSMLGSILLGLVVVSGCAGGGGTPKESVAAVDGQLNYRLSCPRLPRTFSFVLWLSDSNDVIGAGTEYDTTRYQYMASTGELLFKEVGGRDEGSYRCIVKSGKKVTSAVVVLEVKRNYANFWEQEFKENAVRGGVAGGLLLGTVAAVCLVYSCRYKGSSSPSSKGHRGQYNVALEPEAAPEPVALRNSVDLSKMSNGESESQRRHSTATVRSGDNSAPSSPPKDCCSIGVNTEAEGPRQGSTVIYITSCNSLE